ncbi:IclR family transcriptional regulator [Microbacterium sp. BWT-B31]|uniref:IclR family transcriptional regulator n=1 Tax=Microbacterium sp. BWT-B31 TaxID=3232072 RepID=UPI003529B13A
MKVLEKASEVIDVLSKEGPLTPADIAERIGVPRPSVYRLLDGLHAIGLTEPLPDSTAGLSLRWLHLADTAREAMSEWADAGEVLADLVDRTGQTTYLSVLRNNEAVCVEWAQGRAIGVLLLKPGRSLPLHAGAAGRALLAFAADVDSYLATSVRHRYTARTLVDDQTIRDDAEATRARGYAISDGDVTEGIGALGAPVRSATGAVLGVVSIAGLADELTNQRQELSRDLLAAAARLAPAATRA